MTRSEDERFMSMALNLAKRGQYTVHPNPAVGCVVVKDNEIVGQGWHERAGEAHAEVRALADAKERTQQATLYVTLEPCSHTGRTPPCTDAVIRSGISRVVVACQDPNPLVQGQGLRSLEEAGIEVVTGICTEAATHMNRGFFKRMTSEIPFVILKIAASLDGRIAMPNGESRWITCEESRCDVHRLRALSSSVLTGIGTVQKDDPAFTVRHFETSRQPDRVVLDSQMSISHTAKILDDSAKVFVFTIANPSRYKQLNCISNLEIISSYNKENRVELVEMLKECGKRQMNTILVEAGPSLAGNFLKQGLVDELVLYLAPSFLGNDALAMFNLPQITELSEKIQMSITHVESLGSDIKIVLTPETCRSFIYSS
ncbi:MAG: bifunctional diaminohydroxyphosphoribosylaminopyrimidine deaminase/5-amino-6-(5-phosphoribosylamino)uracil reductase RibD [Gammaproteobacteria bacterium]|nr:bifunctional diaminohydroxyphosphoribosylaminopyrimidine deaminase/5-amino-6-(5-phosphoribosylamino)uracil reductase RibD [Gammaproteobacteria bacterium]